MCAVVCRVQVDWGGVSYGPGTLCYVPQEFAALLVETKRARYLTAVDRELLNKRARERNILPIDG